MRLELSDDEGRELLVMLDRFCGELIDEIGHTEDRAFRSDLARSYDRLVAIRDRLQAMVHPTPAPPPQPTSW